MDHITGKCLIHFHVQWCIYLYIPQHIHLKLIIIIISKELFLFLLFLHLGANILICFVCECFHIKFCFCLLRFNMNITRNGVGIQTQTHTACRQRFVWGRNILLNHFAPRCSLHRNDFISHSIACSFALFFNLHRSGINQIRDQNILCTRPTFILPFVDGGGGWCVVVIPQ